MGLVRSLLIDDESYARQNLRRVIDVACPEIRVVGEADSVKSGKDAIRSLKPDLVFLDVEMNDGEGFDLLRQLPDIPFRVIFVTAYEKYALRAIRFSALDFLLKPVQKEDLLAAIAKLKNVHGPDYQRKINLLMGNRPSPTRIALPVIDGYVFIDVESVIRCEADGNYTRFFLDNGEKIMVTRTLKEYEDILEAAGFFRLHHSHLVNLQSIVRYKKGEGGSVILKDGTELEVARRRKDDFLKMIGQR